MTEIVDLAARREARKPHVQGPARCLTCGHEWHVVAPQGVVDGYECPACGLSRGVMGGMIGSDVPCLQCDCGADLWSVLQDGRLLCPGCGDTREWPEGAK